MARHRIKWKDDLVVSVLVDAINRHHGVIVAVASELGISRQSVYYMIRVHGLGNVVEQARKKARGGDDA